MSKGFGVIIASHNKELAEGLTRLLFEMARDVSITCAGGTDDGEIGTSFEKIQQAIKENTANELFAFYDLGSAKMNLEIAIEMIENKKVHLMDSALVEGAFTASTLIQANAPFEEILAQLQPLKVK